MSAQAWEDIRLATVVVQALPQIDMPSLTFKLPYKTGTAQAYLTSQATDIAGHHWATGAATLTAVGVGVNMELASEIEEDSIVPIAPMVISDMSATMSDTLEDMVLNGDDATNHMDTDVVVATDPRKGFDGIRYLCHTNSCTSSLATLTLENIQALRGSMDKYGVNPDQLIYVASPKGHIKLLSLKDANNYPVTVVYRDLLPTPGVTGIKESIDGSPLLISAKVRDTLNTSGIYQNSNKTCLYVINKNAWMFGTRRPLRMASDVFVVADYRVVVMKGRFGFTPKIACTTTYPAAWLGIAMASS